MQSKLRKILAGIFTLAVFDMTAAVPAFAAVKVDTVQAASRGM